MRVSSKTSTWMQAQKTLVKKIEAVISEERLLADLERYRQLAIESGATDAHIIETREINVDERVRAKCFSPKCSHFGTNANCPPYVPDLAFTRALISRYKYGILLNVKSESQYYVGKTYKKCGVPPAKKIFENVLGAIEGIAYYDGYYFSIAFGQGSCKSLYCASEPCGVLTGSGCRFPLKARPSMEAMGIDVFQICLKYGWEVYPCGRRLEPEDIPYILLVGLVLVW